MQKIKGLKPAKGVSITEIQEKFIEREMKRLGIKYLSEYVRYLIDKERQKKSA